VLTPEVRVLPDGEVQVAFGALVCAFTGITSGIAGLQAEMSVRLGDGSLVYGPSQVSLLSPRDLRDVTQALNARCTPPEGEDWGPYLSSAFACAASRWRRLDEVVRLSDVPLEEPSWLVPGVIPEGHIVLWTADGASGKSWLALALALSCACGMPFATRALEPARMCPVIYLDYEADELVQRHRLARLLLGRGLDPYTQVRDLYYVRASRPVRDCVDDIRDAIASTGARLLIVDTLAPAAGGGGADSALAIQFMLALRSLRCTTLLLAHVAKQARNSAGGERTAYGSVFYRNLARGEWSLVGVQDEGDDELRLILQDVKRNLGGRRDPVGVRLRFTRDAVILEEFSPELDPALAEHAPLRTRIRNLLLLTPGGLTTAEIAEDLGSPEASVRTTLHRMQSRGQVRRSSDGTRWVPGEE